MKPIKILLCGCIFNEGNTLLMIAQALSNMGHSVCFWNVMVRNKPPQEYDMAIVWGNLAIPPEMFGDKPVAMVYLDDPEYWKNPQKDDNDDKSFEKVTKGYKHIFTNMKWEGYDEEKHHWIPMGALKDIHGLVNMVESDRKRYGGDVVFIGTNRGERQKLINHIGSYLNKKYSFRIWGNGWNTSSFQTKPVYFYDFSKVLSSSKIVITEHWKNGFSTNDCEKTAVGSALMITDCPIVKQEYPMIPFYNNYDEAVELIHYYLEHEEERLQLVKQLQNIAYEKFDYENQLAKIIDIVMGSKNQDLPTHIK